VTVREKELVRLICYSYWHVEWFHTSNQLPDQAPIHTYSYFNFYATSDSKGKYFCYGFDEKLVPFLDVAKVDVLRELCTFFNIFLHIKLREKYCYAYVISCLMYLAFTLFYYPLEDSINIPSPTISLILTLL